MSVGNELSQIDMAVKVTRIETLMEDMHTRLFGNGQPGELAKIATRMDKQDDEIDALKETKAHAKGVMWAFGALFTALGGSQLWHLFSKRY